MSPTAYFVLAIIAAIADVIAILSWLKVEPSSLLNPEWTMRDIRVTGARLVMIVALPLLGIGIGAYGLYEIHGSEKATAIPRILQWGIGGKHCNVVVDTSLIANLADGYSVVLACGINDPTVDPVEDERIILSGKFGIAGQPQQISAPSNAKFDAVVDSLGNQPLSMWQRVFVVPQTLNLSDIHKLSDVPRLGGKLFK